MVMVHVPGGTFQMGSSDAEIDAVFAQCEQDRGSGNCERSRYEDESPQHTVTLNPFWIDQTEVTNAQFAAFLNDRGNQMEGGVTWLDLEDEACLIEQVEDQYRPESDYADHPVITVSWYGADAYCKWVGAQLPIEAQWEYAARGEEGYIYPWGGEFDCSRGNFDDETEDSYVVPGGEGCDGYVRTAPVGSFPTGRSWCNALDMAGNVWEWTADWYGSYSSASQTNPTGPADGDFKVLRGGALHDGPSFLRAAQRSGSDPGGRFTHVGFRCVAAGPGR
jgi:formylglycine-generating enzyme required for sulfatase activity